MSAISNTRKLKVYSLSQERAHGYKYVPNISFQGDWLKQYGFDAGTLISVICEDGKLTIVPREADPMNPEIQECLDQLEGMSKKKIHLLEQSLEIHKNRKKQ